MPKRLPTYLDRLRAAKPKPVKQDNGNRPSSAAQGYGRQWRKLRLMVLREQPICVHCHREAATQVDHKVAKAKGGNDDEVNLVGLCHSCHSKKTVKEDGAFRRKKY